MPRMPNCMPIQARLAEFSVELCGILILDSVEIKDLWILIKTYVILRPSFLQ